MSSGTSEISHESWAHILFPSIIYGIYTPTAIFWQDSIIQSVNDIAVDDSTTMDRYPNRLARVNHHSRLCIVPRYCRPNLGIHSVKVSVHRELESLTPHSFGRPSTEYGLLLPGASQRYSLKHYSKPA